MSVIDNTDVEIESEMHDIKPLLAGGDATQTTREYWYLSSPQGPSPLLHKLTSAIRVETRNRKDSLHYASHAKPHHTMTYPFHHRQPIPSSTTLAPRPRPRPTAQTPHFPNPDIISHHNQRSHPKHPITRPPNSRSPPSSPGPNTSPPPRKSPA